MEWLVSSYTLPTATWPGSSSESFGQEHETNWTAEASGEHKIGRQDSFPVFEGNWFPPGGIQPPCETSEWSCGSESPFVVMVASSGEWVKRLSLHKSKYYGTNGLSLYANGGRLRAVKWCLQPPDCSADVGTCLTSVVRDPLLSAAGSLRNAAAPCACKQGVMAP